VGHGYYRRLALACDALQQLHHLGATPGVEGCGRLIGEDERRRVGKRTADGYPLLLAAGEIGRQ
jgi:hypothetical protein